MSASAARRPPWHRFVPLLAGLSAALVGVWWTSAFWSFRLVGEGG